MPRVNIFSITKRGSSLKIRSALLIIQFLLSFGLFFSLEKELALVAALIAAAFFFSMIFLVWLG